MKLYYAVLSIFVCILIITFQPQLIVAHHPKQGTELTKKISVSSQVTSVITAPTAEDFITQGYEKFDLEDYQGAIAAYTEAIRLKPNFYRAYTARGFARYRLKDYWGAIADYNQALLINPNDANAYYKRGDSRYDLGDKQGAVADYNQALQIDSNDANAYYKRGNSHYDLGDKQGAVADYNQALRIDPNNFAAKIRRDYLAAKNAINLYSTKQEFRIQQLVVSVILCFVWMLSISVHEFGHAIVAYWGGDKSVKEKGYLTLNPLKYIHPLVSIILPAFFLIFGYFPLPGAAVYIEKERLRNRWWKSAVSAAGPSASFFVTLLLILFFHISSGGNSPNWILAALASFIVLKLVFILFNLMPIPPLDGYGIIEPWLPKSIQAQIRKFSIIGLIAVYMLSASIFGLFLCALAFLVAYLLGIPLTLAFYGFGLFNRWYCALLLTVFGVFALIHQQHTMWNFFGYGLESFKKYEKALAAYKKAIEFKPDKWAWGRQGWVLAQSLQRYEEAIESFEQAIQIDSKYYDSFQLLQQSFGNRTRPFLCLVWLVWQRSGTISSPAL